jgi:hypothetical protein
MSYTYTTFKVALAIEMAVPNNDPADPQFAAVLPTLIDQAEQRVYRDLDLLNATSSQTLPLTAGSSKLDFSTLSPNLLILEDMNIIAPAGVTDPELGERVPAYPVSKEWLRQTWGSSAVRGMPSFFAMSDDRTILLGPFPDADYTVELIGKYRPTPIYLAPPADGTQSTFLTSVLPDVFLAAAMCAGTAYQHNWGAQSDDPRQAMSWEQNYQTLLGSARGEEMRKKYHGWMSMTSEINAAPSQPGTPGPT